MHKQYVLRGYKWRIRVNVRVSVLYCLKFLAVCSCCVCEHVWLLLIDRCWEEFCTGFSDKC